MKKSGSLADLLSVEILDFQLFINELVGRSKRDT